MPRMSHQPTAGASPHSRPFRFAVQSYSATSGQDWRDQARRAEDLGYGALHLADHVIGPGPALAATNHPVQDVAAIPAMAVAAEATTTLTIGCRVLCTDYRNPVILAKELATLDLFAPGRIEIGLGAGWLANEYAAIGVPFDRPGVRIDRMLETLAVIRACFAGEPVDVVGEHVHATGFTATPPRPATPRLMIGGGARRILGIAAREADVVSLNFDNSAGRIGPEGIGSGTADGTAEKIGWVRTAAGTRFDSLELEIGAYFCAVTDQTEATLGAMAPRLGLTAEQLAEHPHALIGSVDQIIEHLLDRRERYGISSVTVGRTVAEQFAPIVAKLTGI
jgi:probable F420-dependent oxidoreductase